MHQSEFWIYVSRKVLVKVWYLLNLDLANVKWDIVLVSDFITKLIVNKFVFHLYFVFNFLPFLPSKPSDYFVFIFSYSPHPSFREKYVKPAKGVFLFINNLTALKCVLLDRRPLEWQGGLDRHNIINNNNNINKKGILLQTGFTYFSWKQMWTVIY